MNQQVSTDTEVSARISAKFKVAIAFLGSGEVSTEAEVSSNKEKNEIYETIEYNLDLANDVCEILDKVNFKEYIILENFHYLDIEVQRKVAFDLRTSHDNRIYFVIIGIWSPIA